MIKTYIRISSIVTFMLCFSYIFSQQQDAITYGNGGRFGDNIFHYTRAKWLAFKHDLLLLYKPFQYSHMLTLHELETHYDEKYFNEKAPAANPSALAHHPNQGLLFIRSVAKQQIQAQQLYERTIHYPEFGTEIKKMLQPIVPISQLDLPQDRITVAVHIRKGGGYDQPLISEQEYTGHENLITYEEQKIKKSTYADKIWPSKFPPDQYYIDQLKKLSEMLNNQPLFVYIFTDDKNPKQLMKKIEKKVNKLNITFSCRTDNNTFTNHGIDDFYAIAQFDCLIRGCSNFAWASQLIGNHSIIMYPKSAKWDNKKIIIDKVFVIIRDNQTDHVKKYLFNHTVKDTVNHIIG